MRFLIMLTFQLRRVERREWLRVLPKAVFLPVLAQMRDIGVFEELRTKNFTPKGDFL